MAEVNQAATMPADVPIAAQQAIEDKLRDATRRNHERAEARRAAGQPATVGEMLATQQPWHAEAGASNIIAHIGAERIPPDEPTIARTWTMPPGYAEAIVPKKFRAVTLETYEPKTQSQQVAKRVVGRWLEVVRGGGAPMLALIGQTGTGKSHLLYAAANALLAENRRVYARGWYRLADELRFGGLRPWGQHDALEPSAVRDLVWSSPIVMLDEVRVTAGTAFDDTELAKLACHAYDADLPMIITTNVSPLAEVMGPPAASRFTQVVIEGPDWRQR